MLATDVQLIDIDAAHWANWFDLLVPPRLRDDSRVAVVFTEERVPIKVIVRGQGALPLERVPFTGTSKSALEQLARDLEVQAVFVVEREIIAEMHRAIESELHIADDYVAQGLTVLRALERHRNKWIWAQPPILDLIPPLSYDPLQRTFNTLIADGTSMLAYVFEDDGSDVHASIIAVKRKGDLDLVTTHLGLEPDLSGPELARDWRKGYRRLNQLVGTHYDKPSLSVFLDRSTFMRILTGPADQLGREINRRNVILDPAPAWLLGLLGSATMAAVAGRGAKALARMLPWQARSLASNLASTARSVMRESGAHPFALLGFDPIQLWHQVRGLYRPPGA